jgi:hypothetical protein
MMPNPSLVWQALPSSEGQIYRAKVTGGWLVMLSSYEKGGLTFYPDPNHEWNGGSLP